MRTGNTLAVAGAAMTTFGGVTLGGPTCAGTAHLIVLRGETGGVTWSGGGTHDRGGVIEPMLDAMVDVAARGVETVAGTGADVGTTGWKCPGGRAMLRTVNEGAAGGET